MKKLLAIILALACCLSLMACSVGGTIPETTEPTQTQQSTEPSSDNTTQATQPVVNQPQQNTCYWCGEMPVGDGETYCVNCRCLKCGKLRKDGGGKYVYCRNHNCNESLCEYPAFDDSQYCLGHKCSNQNCDFRRWPGAEYCIAHNK